MSRRPKEERKYMFTYMSINKITGKMYIGAHTTNNIDDGYVGSGVGVTEDCKRYGKDSFVVISRWFHDSYEKMMKHESDLVTVAVISSDKWYNRLTGGAGGSYIPTSESRKRQSLAKIGEEPWNKGLSTGTPKDAIERHRIYNENPKKCIICNKAIHFKFRNKHKYCSKTCANSDKENWNKSDYVHKANSGSFKVGHEMSKETSLKISQSLTGMKRPRGVCPHCGTEGAISLLKRWHYDNCKKRNN